MRYKILAIGLFICCVGFAILGGCAGESSPKEPLDDPKAEKPDSETTSPEPLQSAETQPWETHSPFRHSMKRMWLDMGLIVAAGSDPEKLDLDFIENSGSDIETRAQRYADYWLAARDFTLQAIKAGRSGDWLMAGDALSNTHNACTKCHYEFWPMSSRGFTQVTVDAWQETQSPFGEKYWSAQTFSAPEGMANMMNEMRLGMAASFDAIRAEDSEAFQDAPKRLYKLLDLHYKWWRDIALYAGKIRRARFENTMNSVPENFNKIRNICINCHAQFSNGKGKVPLPWPVKSDD